MTPDMPASLPSTPRAAAPVRVLVAAGAAASAALRGQGPGFDFVDDAEAAVERAMSEDYALILLDLELAGIGATAAADILRRAGAPGALVALGTFAPGDAARDAFDRCLAPPVSGEAVRALLASMRPPSALADAMGADWIARECADLVAEFHAGLPAAAAALRGALAGRDLEALRSTVHALKGSAGAYGLAAITQRCAAIEAGFRAGNTSAATSAAAVLAGDLDRLGGAEAADG